MRFHRRPNEMQICVRKKKCVEFSIWCRGYKCFISKQFSSAIKNITALKTTWSRWPCENPHMHKNLRRNWHVSMKLFNKHEIWLASFPSGYNLYALVNFDLVIQIAMWANWIGKQPLQRGKKKWAKNWLGHKMLSNLTNCIRFLFLFLFPLLWNDEIQMIDDTHIRRRIFIMHRNKCSFRPILGIYENI